MQIRISDLINPHFDNIWTTEKPYVILKGGRNSFKSSVISLRLVSKMIENINSGIISNAIILMNHENAIRDGVFRQIQWAISMLHADLDFAPHFSPFWIRHRRTGATFYFYGDDSPDQLKGNTVPNIFAVWYEEAANFKTDEVFKGTNPTFIRHKHPLVKNVKVYYSYNPPKNPFTWVNDWVEECEHDERYLVDHSTYLDDTKHFNTEQILADIEAEKKYDYDHYRWRWLGESVGLGNSVWKASLFQPLKELPKDDPIVGMAFSTDVGHEVSATTIGAWLFTYNGNIILDNNYYYSPAGKVNKKAPSQLADDYISFTNKIATEFDTVPVYQETIDSAEGGLRNELGLKTGRQPHPVHKFDKTTMIEMSQDLLAQGRVYYIDRPENQIFVKQVREYRWDERTIQTVHPEVIKLEDHHPDEFQYLVVDNARRLGIKR
ncbi:terminase large subunit [Oenococcus phage vB_OeS_unk162]|nr:terminase large subunit [Oenococcus phage vB_OeS_unk162]